MGRKMSFRVCKVKGCERKHKAKGYCRVHYQRNCRNHPLTPKCKQCGKNLSLGQRNICSEKCRKIAWCISAKTYYKKHKDKIIKYHNENFVNIPRIGGVGKAYVFTDGVTEEMKPLVPKIVNDVFEDCIKNPGKYLDGAEKAERIWAKTPKCDHCRKRARYVLRTSVGTVRVCCGDHKTFYSKLYSKKDVNFTCKIIRIGKIK